MRVIYGDNVTARDEAVAKLVNGFKGSVIKIDGSESSLTELKERLSNQTLFKNEELFVIKRLSENGASPMQIVEVLESVPDDMDIVIVEHQFDKRTTLFKWLEKNAQTEHFMEWTAKDRRMAEAWVLETGKRRGIAMTTRLAGTLVQRVGYEQWRLSAALAKLELVDDIETVTLDNLVEPREEDRVFELLATALQGDGEKVKSIVGGLRLTDDPYRVFGLLASQAMQLTAVVLGDRDTKAIAADTGIHPYALSRLASQARTVGISQAKRLIELLAHTDMRMKTTSHEGWLLIEQMLLKLAISSR